MKLSFNYGLIIDIDSDPFGHDAFTPHPGIIVRGPSGRSGTDAQIFCLLEHERVHWVQWFLTAAVPIVILWLIGFPGWSFGLAWFTFPICYLVLPFFKKTMENWANDVQRECLRDLEG